MDKRTYQNKVCNPLNPFIPTVLLLKPFYKLPYVIILTSPDLIPHVPQDSLQLKIIKGAFLEQSPFMLHLWHSSNSSLQPCSILFFIFLNNSKIKNNQ